MMEPGDFWASLSPSHGEIPVWNRAEKIPGGRRKKEEEKIWGAGAVPRAFRPQGLAKVRQGPAQLARSSFSKPGDIPKTRRTSAQRRMAAGADARTANRRAEQCPAALKSLFYCGNASPLPKLLTPNIPSFEGVEARGGIEPPSKGFADHAAEKRSIASFIVCWPGWM